MKVLRIAALSALLATGTMGSAAVHAQVLSEAARDCLKVGDDAQRLACFDREIGRLVKQPSAAAGPAPAAPAVAAAAPVAQAAATAAPVASEAEFGVRGSQVAKKQDIERPQLESLTAKVTEITTRARGERVVTLDNGQVWVELRPEGYFPVKVGDAITIQSGSLNSYRMQLNGRSTQVRRQQ
jgi:hypothetical protein